MSKKKDNNLVELPQVEGLDVSAFSPSSIYFSDFLAMQHIGLTVSCKNMKSKIWNKYVESDIADLRLSEVNDIFNFERLINADDLIVMPQISLATSQGFMPNWSCR